VTVLPACWACFMIFDTHVEVLAIIGARSWTHLHRGWYRPTDAEIDHHQMTHHKLRQIAFKQRRP
jgi:hypothetical protein